MNREPTPRETLNFLACRLDELTEPTDAMDILSPEELHQAGLLDDAVIQADACLDEMRDVHRLVVRLYTRAAERHQDLLVHQIKKRPPTHTHVPYDGGRLTMAKLAENLRWFSVALKEAGGSGTRWSPGGL